MDASTSQKRKKEQDAEDERFSGSFLNDGPVFNRWGLEQQTIQNSQRKKQNYAPAEKQSCWFCLSNKDVEKHLIVSIGKHNYLALAKGGLVDFHLLIIPILHVSSVSELKEESLQEIEKYKIALQECFAARNESIIVHELNISTKGTKHLHIQVVPISNALAKIAEDVFQSEAYKLDIKFEQHENSRTLAEITATKSYFMIELPFDQKYLIYFVQKHIPLQIGREMISTLLHTPQKADWKACKADYSTECRNASDFKTLFKNFDFTTQKIKKVINFTIAN